MFSNFSSFNNMNLNLWERHTAQHQQQCHTTESVTIELHMYLPAPLRMMNISDCGDIY